MMFYNRMRLRQNGLCQLCDINDIETTNHFMFECPAFENLRVDFFSEITDTLSCNDLPIDVIGMPFDYFPLLNFIIHSKEPIERIYLKISSNEMVKA
jgi:hypothetical protein